jgi:hypothetical protein
MGVLAGLAAVFAVLLLVVLGAGYRVHFERARIDAYVRAQGAFVDTLRRLKVRRAAALRQMREELRDALEAWAARRAPFETPLSERLKKQIRQLNAVVRARPDVLASALKLVVRQSAADGPPGRTRPTGGG